MAQLYHDRKFSNLRKEMERKKKMSIDRPTAGDIWQTLSAINVNEHTEKKQGGTFQPTYLSWTWAWQTMQEKYPEIYYKFQPNEVHADSTVTVHVTCYIGEVERSMWLAVMDNKFKGKPNPSSSEIANSKMRCLTKCFAMFGLGHYIYAGEDIPQDSIVGAPQKRDYKEERSSELDNIQAKLEAVALTFKTFIEDAKDIDYLRDFWKKNKDALQELEKHAPAIFNDVKEGFVAKSKEVNKANATDGENK